MGGSRLAAMCTMPGTLSMHAYMRQVSACGLLALFEYTYLLLRYGAATPTQLLILAASRHHRRHEKGDEKVFFLPLSLVVVQLFGWCRRL